MKEPGKIKLIKVFFLLLNLVVVFRLFYWQFLSSEKLTSLAEDQYFSSSKIEPLRGEILSSDGFPLVSNEKVYLLYALKEQLKDPAQKIAGKLAPIFLALDEQASPSGNIKKSELSLKIETEVKEKLNQEDLLWLPLRHQIPESARLAIEDLNLNGLGFEEETARIYPEASSAAQLLGFVGKNEAGQPTGYFGLEGFYNLELKGKPGKNTQEKDALGRPILLSGIIRQEKVDGSNLILNLNRSLQLLVEKKLEKALEKYGAKGGSVIISDPKTGKILSLASLPKYDLRFFQNFEKNLFKNPTISDFYEPGSTFKVFTMAAALDQDVIKPETKCEICDQPLKLDKYLIRTWNDKYYPDSTMSEVLEHSDNIGMVFVVRKLGLDKFLTYYKLFGFEGVTGIDLQEETAPLAREKEKWSEVDLATAAFGQGIAVTPIQMLQAINTIANNGEMMVLQVVSAIENDKEKIEKKPELVRKVIKPQTAKVLTEMMIKAVDNGEARWAKPAGFKIAGKTGTSQIPIAGHYDKEKTIASFIGFAPADNPVFSMLVTLNEPKSSPWGSETAAPLWFDIAKELFISFNLQPE